MFVGHQIVRPQGPAHGITFKCLFTQVAAACIYCMCREEHQPFMLIDFSDALQASSVVCALFAKIRYANALAQLGTCSALGKFLLLILTHDCVGSIMFKNAHAKMHIKCTFT